jgi:hypothetical protein
MSAHGDMHRVCMALVVAAMACSDSTPAALVVDRNPLLLNGPGAIRLPARVLTRSGRTLRDVPILATPSDDSIVSVTDSTLRCVREGDATLGLAAGHLTGELHVRCRPIGSFAPFSHLELAVDGPPQPLPVVAYAIDAFPPAERFITTVADFARREHRRVEELSFSAHVRDTTVARVNADGQVQPLALGKTRITLDFVGLTHIVPVTVIQPLSTDTVHLASGEYRNWELEPGRYRLSVVRADGSETPAGTEMGAVGANCARDRYSRETLHCVVYDGERGHVIVRAPRASQVVVHVARMP